MIYFTDLDRTLIYSKKFTCGNEEEICIEKYNGEDISFMTKNSIQTLKDILLKNQVIPCTTRSIEQFERIEFKKQGINFEWAIVCNGAYILHNGKRLKEWDDILLKKLSENESFENIRKEFEKYKSIQGILRVREVYNLFFYLVVDKEEYNEELLSEFISYLDKSGWDIHTSGRKVYFLPRALKKENAVKFLSNYLNKKEFAALGDSSMDLNMIKISNKGYIPRDCYLTHKDIEVPIFVPKNKGLKGIEEILLNILQK